MKYRSFLVFALIVCFGGTGYSNVISWNKDVCGTLNDSDRAGVLSVSNWNNSIYEENTFNLRDNEGTETPLYITTHSFNNFPVVGYHPGLDADGTANREMLNGYLNAGDREAQAVSVVELNDIPYPRYDIYVYFSSDVEGRVGSVSVAGETYRFCTLGAASVTDSNALFKQADASSTVNDQANFARFSGLSGDRQTIEIHIPLFGGIAGFQLVEAAAVETVAQSAPSPEPTNAADGVVGAQLPDAGTVAGASVQVPSGNSKPRVEMKYLVALCVAMGIVFGVAVAALVGVLGRRKRNAAGSARVPEPIPVANFTPVRRPLSKPTHEA